jgi:superfamily II DNA or RNA helicase
MFGLRYYQSDAKAAVYDAWQGHGSTAVVLPTACGKTELYLSIVTERPGRSLVLVHRDYLITSPIRRLERVGFHDVAVEKAESRSERGLRRARVVFASVQSVGPAGQSARLEAFDPADFHTLVVDEAHRAVSPSYRRVLGYFRSRNPKIKVLLLTATPKRKDGLALGNVCESVAYEMSPGRAAAEGWIAAPRFFVRDVPGLDFSKIALKGNDLDQDQIAELLVEEEPLHKVLASLAEDQGPTIVFCPKVDVAEAYAAVMHGRYRRGRAVAISQHSSDEECERATRGLADGSIDYLFNVDKVTEGYDVPRVVRVVWAAPTASLVRWTQGCGRGFRPDASVAGQLKGGPEDAATRRLLIEQSAKPFCSVVTYHPSNCRHQICTAVDLLGGLAIDPELKRSSEQVQEQTARQAGGSNTEEDLETARAFLDLRAVIEERRRLIKAKATVADSEYDGLGGPSVNLMDGNERVASKTAQAVSASWGPGDPATEKQVKWLVWKGVSKDDAVACTRWRASVVRDLYELGVTLPEAMGYGKRQALKVRDDMRARKGVTS